MQFTGGPLEPGSVVDGYRVDEMVSRGGMGVVYRVTHVALGRIYALKVLAPELAADEQYRERFRREIRIAASLHHPHVVGIHYAGEHQGMLFLVMDFVSGTDLNQVTKRAGALEPSRAAAILAQVASALDAAHQKGLVHRDVKPANVLISVRDGEEHVYLTDFGVAKKFDTVSGVEDLTRQGAVVGTVEYMSPEQIIGGHTDARTDIYALGCVFFQMLTGQLPYERENSVATLFAHVHEPPPTLPSGLAERYPTFGAVIEKATAKEPEQRYLSAGDFARDAAAALVGSRYAAPPALVATGEASPFLQDEPAPPVADPPRPEVPAGPGRNAIYPLAGADAPQPDLAARAPTQPDRTAPDRQPAQAPSAQRRPDVPREGPREPPGGAPPPPAQGAPSWGRRNVRWIALAGIAVIAAAVVGVIVSSSKNAAAKPSFASVVHPVQTNRVHGTGTAAVQLQGNVATVTVTTHGLLAAAHLMHIHGGTGSCPTASAATVVNGHRFVSAGAADPIYGGVVASLTQTGATSPDKHLISRLYPAVGNIRYTRTFTLAPGVAAEIRQGIAVIVVHGIDYNGNGRYDNFLGKGGEASAPALCGPLEPQQTASVPTQGSRTIYTASLDLYRVTATERSGRVVLLCHLVGAPPEVADSRVAGST
jgi:hypothetical protein